MNNAGGTTGTNTTVPTGAQLTEARLKQWHQQGEALLTIENMRSWINAAGLALYAPKPQIASPAGSVVEAVLGAAKASPTVAEAAEARALLARMVAEGMAVPLNLMGGTGAGLEGETPDFVCSTAVFSYVFTLRGDKAWKKAPETSGAVKVSPLALAAYEALGRRGALSVYDLATELGKEVTEAAVLRALGELWTHLRVLPMAQPEGAATLWELSSARFSKQIKAGANAGQPTALSALITLYLGQAVVATEDEIESFLSPLAARSRIRDVVHALLAARQLETVAVDGRTQLHVAGDLPVFAAPAVDETAASAEAAAGADAAEGGSRIAKFVAKPKKIGTGYLAKASPSKSAGKFTGGAGATARPGARFGSKPAFGAKAAFGKPAGDRERRPFGKAGAGSAKPGFDKPWEEEKAKRLTAAARPSEVSDAADGAAPAEGEQASPRVRPERSFARKPAFGGKPAFGRKPAFGGKPAFGSRPVEARGEGSASGDGRPPRREYKPRTAEAGGDTRPPRKTFSKPGTFGRKREASAGGGSEGRPPRRDFAAGADRAGRTERSPRGDRPASAGPRVPGSYAARPRPAGAYGDRAAGGREGGGFAPRKTNTPRGEGGAGKPGFTRSGPRAGGAGAGRPPRGEERGGRGEGAQRVYRKFDAPRDRPAGAGASDRPARPASSDRPARTYGSDRPARPAGGASRRGASGGYAGKSGGGFKSPRPSGKPGGGFAGKKPFGGAGKGGAGNGKPGAGKPAGTFAKFADGAKPFGNRPPARKYKPRDGESA